MPSDYDSVVDAGRGFLDRARKAVYGAVATGVTTAAGVVGTALLADGFSVEAVVGGVSAGVVAAFAALKVIYDAENKPA